MPSPSIVFSFMLATLCGSLFHVFAGGDARRLALFLLAGWVGFTLGQIVGELVEITVITIGPLNVVTALTGAVIALLTVWLLTRRKPDEYIH